MEIEREKIRSIDRLILQGNNLKSIYPFISNNVISSTGYYIKEFIKMEDETFHNIRNRYCRTKEIDKLKALNPDRYISIDENSIVYFVGCNTLPESYKSVVQQGYSEDIVVYPLLKENLYFEEVLIFEKDGNKLILNHNKTPEYVGKTFLDWYKDHGSKEFISTIKESFFKNYTLVFSGHIIGSSVENSLYLKIISKNEGRYTSETEVVKLALKNKPTLTKKEFEAIRELVSSNEEDSVKHGLNILTTYNYTKHSFLLSNMLYFDSKGSVEDLNSESNYMANNWLRFHLGIYEISDEDIPLCSDYILENIRTHGINAVKYLDMNGFEVEVKVKRKTK